MNIFSLTTILFRNREYFLSCEFPIIRYLISEGLIETCLPPGDGKGVFMKQPRIFLLFVEAILQLSPIVTGECVLPVAIVTD